MKATVHILARVRKPELLPAALLVFRTLRVGYPASPVQVWGNALSLESERAIAGAAAAVGAHFVNIAATSHDAWMESLILESTQPFWVLDTDVAFWANLEDAAPRQQGPAEFRGRFEPKFWEPYTDTLHVERLHTCVMWIDPAATRAAIRKFMAEVPEDLRQFAQFPMVREHFVPVQNSRPVFYDTMAGLYQSGAGAAFTEAENDCFDHLHCGSYVDLVSPSLDKAREDAGPTLKQVHQAVYQDVNLLRGARHQQEKFYAEHPWGAARPAAAIESKVQSPKSKVVRKEKPCRTHRE